jgi:hypothetical protein
VSAVTASLIKAMILFSGGTLQRINAISSRCSTGTIIFSVDSFPKQRPVHYRWNRPVEEEPGGNTLFSFWSFLCLLNKLRTRVFQPGTHLTIATFLIAPRM